MIKSGVIIGYSGHAFVVIDTLLSNNYTLFGYCEQKEKENNPYNLNFLGSEEAIDVLGIIKDKDVFLGIGSNSVRRIIFEYLMRHNLSCPSLIHPNAYVSPMAVIGIGTIVMPGTIINSNSVIGNAVICNSACVIEHECKIGNYSHIAPGAVIAGNVNIGINTFVGANSVIRQGLNIGSNVVIGAGAVVTKNIRDGEVVYGNPAKIKKNE